ncbi:MAG: hypothetical protein ACYDDF_05750 [Thermoplasmatota archaeon]
MRQPGGSVLLHEKKAPLEAKELRVKIHVEYHLKLHALKLLRGKNMSEAVEEALDHYFQIMRLRDEDIAQSVPPSELEAAGLSGTSSASAAAGGDEPA